MFASLAALPGFCGALDGFSLVVGLVEALELVCGAVAETAGAWPTEVLGLAAVVDCEAMVLELVEAPVVLGAWLFGFVLVALVCPLLGFAVELTPVSVLALGVLEDAGAAADALVLCVAVAPVELLASVGLLLLVEFPELALTDSWSCTCFMPLIDLARSPARFLSACEGTVPVMVAVWFVTET
jgi:hypothetical protein